MTVEDSVREVAQRCAERLRAAGVTPESLGEYQPARRKFLRTVPAKIVPAGRVWRLGVLLVGETGELFTAGSTLRAHEPPPILGYTSESARARDALRHAAIRGGFAEGTTVHYDARLVDAAHGAKLPEPLVHRDGELVVRWNARAPLNSAMPLSHYLDERAELLIHPPLGAT